jgi:hypothetical protein
MITLPEGRPGATAGSIACDSGNRLECSYHVAQAGPAFRACEEQDSMYVIGHDNEFIEHNRRKTLRQVAPGGINDFT